MRNARKVVLLAVMALAAMAISASSASALEVTDEATGNHCTSTTFVNHGSGTGGCTLSAANEGSVELGTPFGMIDCDNEFNGRVGENGSGFIFAANLFNCNPSTVEECKEAGVPDNWPVRLTAENAMEAQFCVVAFGFLTVNCHLTGLAFTQASHTSAEVATTGHQACEGGGNSVEGHWSVTAPGVGLEVND